MCIGLAKSGAACKRSAMKGEDYCSAHINQKPAVVEPAQEEPVADFELQFEVEQNNVATDIDEATPITMPPQQRDITTEPDALPITDTASKVALFNDIGATVFNIGMKFLPNEAKKATFYKKWETIHISERITGKSFAIRTGSLSGITVFDVDQKSDAYHKGPVDGAGNLMDANVDFDEYKDKCIVVQTQSGGKHYIFKYDSRFKNGSECYGVKGFDIRNDGGCIYAGERYDIVSLPPNGIQLPPDQIYDTLSSLEEKPAATTNIVSSAPAAPAPIASSDEISEKYHELLKLLPDPFFLDHDKWVKPIYALKNEVAAGKLNNDEAFATANKLFVDRSGTAYNETELTRVWGLEMKDREKRFTMGSIVKILKDTRFDDWSAWNDKWYPKQGKSEPSELSDAVVKRNFKLLTYIANEIGMDVNDIETAINDTEPEFAFDWRKKYSMPLNRPITDVYRRWGQMIDYIHNYEFTCNIQAAKLLALFIDKYYVIMINGEHYKRPDLTKIQDNSSMKPEPTDPLKTMLFHINGKPVSASALIYANAPYFHKYENFTVSFEQVSSASDPHEFNSCVPFKAKLLPKCDESKISGIMQFFEEVICDGNKELFNQFLTYLAKLFQFSDTKTEIVPVFYSAEEGCGKTTICDILTALIGIASIDVSAGSIESLVSERREHLVGKKLAIVNEVHEMKNQFVKNHEAFKSFASDKYLDYRPLYGAKRVIRNLMEVVITTNNLNSMPTGKHARRLQLFKLSTKYMQNGEYFGNLYEKYIDNTDAMNHLYTYLMRNVEVSRGPITNIVQTEGQTEFIEANQDSVAAFWTHIIKNASDTFLDKPTAYETYTKWCKVNGETHIANSRSFGTKSNGLKGIKDDRSGSSRFWSITRD